MYGIRVVVAPIAANRHALSEKLIAVRTRVFTTAVRFATPCGVGGFAAMGPQRSWPLSVLRFPLLRRFVILSETIPPNTAAGVQVFVGEAGGFRLVVLRLQSIPPARRIPPAGNRLKAVEKEEKMARRRFQDGHLYLKKGKRKVVWMARWKEDVLHADATLARVNRNRVLGTLEEFPTKRLAQRALREKLRDLNLGRQRPQRQIPFADLAAQWETSILPMLKDSTARYYRVIVRAHLLPAFADCKLCDLDRAGVQSFLSGKVKDGYAPRTIKGLRGCLSKIFSSAVEWGYVESNPAQGTKLPQQRSVRQYEPLSPVEFNALLAVLPEPYRSLVLLSGLTGLRVGELLALHWEHLDFSANLIRVRQRVYAGRFDVPKTRASRRDLPMTPMVKAMLLGLGKPRPGQLVFPSRAGTALLPGNLRERVLKPACKKAGIRHVSWHDLRHAFATWLGSLGESPRTAQALLGHSDIKTTLGVYTHSLPQVERAALEHLERFLFPSSPSFATEGRQLSRQERVGAGGPNRTGDLPITNRLLYR